MLAILTEVTATVALRFTEGLTRLGPLVAVVVGYGLSFVFLALVLKYLSLSLPYAIWAGAGTALVAAVGIAALGEPATALKLAGIVLVVAGIVALNLGE